MARGWKDLKKEYEGREDEFNSLAKKVTNNYVSSLPEYSQDQLAKDFGLSTSCVRKLMDHAIVEGLVSKEIAVYVMKKSVMNQQRKHAEAGASSIRHHNELMKKREENVANRYTSFDISVIVNEIAFWNIDFKVAIRNFNLESERVLKLILQRAIAENICSDEEADILIERGLNKNMSRETVKYFRELIEKRVETKKNKN